MSTSVNSYGSDLVQLHCFIMARIYFFLFIEGMTIFFFTGNFLDLSYAEILDVSV